MEVCLVCYAYALLNVLCMCVCACVLVRPCLFVYIIMSRCYFGGGLSEEEQWEGRFYWIPNQCVPTRDRRIRQLLMQSGSPCLGLPRRMQDWPAVCAKSTRLAARNCAMMTKLPCETSWDCRRQTILSDLVFHFRSWNEVLWWRKSHKMWPFDPLQFHLALATGI